MKKITLLPSLFIACISLAATTSLPSQDKEIAYRNEITFNNDGIPQTGGYLPGRIHIKFKPETGPFTRTGGPVITGIPSLDQKMVQFDVQSLTQRFRQKYPARKTGLPDLSRIHLLTFPEQVDPHMVAKAFSADPSVEYAEIVPVHRLLDVPDDPYYISQQHLPQIMAAEAWNIHKGENGTVPVTVAIVDAGTDWRHEDLVSNTWQNLAEDADNDGHTIEFINGNWELDPGDMNGIDNDLNGFADDLVGWDFHEYALNGNGSDPDPVPNSSVFYHGTHVAGISAGVTDNEIGIASISWNVKFMPLQSDNGLNTMTYGIDAIVYAAEQGADVINNSWGGYYSYMQTEADVINYATGLGSIVIAAAGNENSNELHFPSDYPGVISVASVNEDDTKTGYSCYGPGVDISAPGGGSEGGILSTMPNNTYGLLSGTSMASPLAAGLAALIKSYHPTWPPEEVINQLISTTDNIDSVNQAEYQYMLGSGRINALKALDMLNPQPPVELKFRYVSGNFNDENANTMFEPGETATLTIRLRNHSALAGSDNVTFKLTSNDSQVIVLDSIEVDSVTPDSFIDLTEVFQIQAASDASPHVTNLVLTISADVPVVYGQQLLIPLLVAPSGMLVFEGEEGGQDYSGTFIKDFLTEMGYPVIYTNIQPSSFAGFDAIFLSYGNFGELLDKGTMLTYEMSQPVEAYAESGGRIYIEASSMFSGSEYFNYPNALNLQQLFGVESCSFEWISNPINNLAGNAGTLCEGMQFATSTQQQNWYIDQLTPLPSAACPFYESDYGNVSIYNTGTLGQKTFYFGYSMADLVDESPISSRYNFLLKVLHHLGYEQDSGYVVANLDSDVKYGEGPLVVHFYDLSITDTNFTVNSWQWDFNNDGSIDSQEQNPVFTYTVPGDFDVRLIVSNGYKTDTIIKRKFIHLQDGLFVFEGIENGLDYSGSWIRDFLIQNMLTPVTYKTKMPNSLIGYDVAFLSFGNYGGNYTVLSNEIASIIKAYLQNGGRLYLEGGDALGFDQENNALLHFLFGLSDAEDGTGNILDELSGLQGSIVDGIKFDGTNQFNQEYIDIYSPGLTGKAAFVEAGYDTVAIQNEGIYGQKTFCFSYSLAQLKDGDNTREELMWAILNFFGLYTGLGEDQSLTKDDIIISFSPNPFKNEIAISCLLKHSAMVELRIFDSFGRQVAEPVKAFWQKGEQRIEWDARNLPSGMYYYRFSDGNCMFSGKIIKFD